MLSKYMLRVHREIEKQEGRQEGRNLNIMYYHHQVYNVYINYFTWYIVQG